MKLIGYVNLVGVLALAALCAVQWRANGRIHLETIALEKSGLSQAQRIDEQDRAVRGYVSDLDDLRHRLEQSDKALREAENNVITLATDRDRAVMVRDLAIAERDKSRIILEKWVVAVKERDITVKKANEAIQKLAEERNSAIGKFNELAGKYNVAIKDLNATRLGGVSPK